MTDLTKRVQSPVPDKYRSNWKTLNGVWEFFRIMNRPPKVRLLATSDYFCLLEGK